MLYDYLLEIFGKNEPIFLSDIHYEDYSDIWLKKKLAKLCESNQVIRYERGIYYIPVKTPFGNSILNPNRIIERKYLSEREIVSDSIQVSRHCSRQGFLHRCQIFLRYKRITKTQSSAE